MKLTGKQLDDVRVATVAIKETPRCPACGQQHFTDEEWEAIGNAIAIQAEVGTEAYREAYKEAMAS